MIRPYISVIITAYNRKQFLKEAVESVLSQTLNKELYEIILIKNFETRYDRQWAKKGVKLLFRPSGTVGAFLNDAINAAQGEVVSFLDDDDLFDRHKLDKIYRNFCQDPNLIYYYNGREYIDDSSNPVREIKISQSLANPKGSKESSTSKSSSYRIILLNCFNISCISIRRDVAFSRLKWLKRMPTMQDTFMGCAALSVLNGSALISADTLTGYRIHKSNTSSFSNISSMNKRIHTYTNKCYRTMRRMLEESNGQGLSALDALMCRMKIDNQVLNAKQIKAGQLLGYIMNYSLPLLFYCRKIDRFLFLATFSYAFKKSGQSVLKRLELSW